MSDITVQSKPRKWWLTFIKPIVTIGLCAVIIYYVDWTSFIDTLRTANMPLTLLVFALLFLSVPISGYKWQQLLAVHEVHYGLIPLQRWYLTALFVNYFLPTSIGGDSYRIYKTWDNPKAKSCAVLAVFMERLTGLLGLLLIGYVAAIIQYMREGDVLSRLLVVVGTVSIVAGVIAALIIVQFRLTQKLVDSRWCPGPIKTLIHFAGDYRTHPWPATVAILISFVFQAHTILFHWVMLAALGVRCDPAQLAVAVAGATVIGLLPISLGGLGLVDGSFMYLIGLYGVGYEVALSAMLLIRVLVVPMSLSGAYFYFMEAPAARRVIRRTDENSTEEER